MLALHDPSEQLNGHGQLCMHDAPITPKFLSSFNREIAGDYA